MDTLQKTAKNVKQKIQQVTSGSHVQKDTTLTTMFGCPIGNNKNSLTAGPHGPVMLQDNVLLEKITQFTREQTPPRNVHALGTGAYGTFTVTGDITRYTKAKLFQPGTKTETFTRISGTFTKPGEAETIRDLRGFATKFYTEDGNYDMMCINTPVFNCRDAKVGPDAIHASKRDPRDSTWNPTSLWDYTVNHLESLHFVTMLYTDRIGTPLSFRHMDAYGCNTFSLLNEEGERHWVKFHFISKNQHVGMTQDEAKMIASEDPDFCTRDLKEAIDKKNFPKWTLYIQVMPEEKGYNDHRTFDCTKVWCHKEYPLIEVGELELNRNPEDFFSEVEQVCFSPANLVPGIGVSPDKLLQGRLLIYDDAQHHRIGPNHKLVPINYPKNAKIMNPLHNGGGNFQTISRNKWPNYHPSDFSSNEVDTSVIEPPIKVDGDVGYYDYPLDGTNEDYFDQVKTFWNVLDDTQKVNLCTNIATSLSKVPKEIASKVIKVYSQVSDKFGSMLDKKYSKRTKGEYTMTESEKVYLNIKKKVATA